jgi:acetyl-CoA C-acetyltransferase
MPEAVIVSTARSPIGRAMKGSLAECRPDDLGATIVKAALDKVPALDRSTIDDLILGCGQPAGESGFNLARVVSLLSGLHDVPGVTINRYCSSSLQSIRMAAHAIKAGEGDVFVAAGAENVSRRDMDEFAARSQQLAVANQESGYWDGEITPITTPSGTVVTKDDGPRPGTTVEKLAELKPVFRPDGEVTAGNACPLNDGAAAVIVMSDARAAELGLTPLARVVSSGVTGLNPEIMGLGPIEATRQALRRAGMTPDDIDLFEINEAFAAQVLPSARHIGIPMDKLNVKGGAIALGHPFGMTGARIATTLIHALQDEDKTFGLETMCVGGGQGMAMIFERLS